jgi:hypothetical protein
MLSQQLNCSASLFDVGCGETLLKRQVLYLPEDLSPTMQIAGGSFPPFSPAPFVLDFPLCQTAQNCK